MFKRILIFTMLLCIAVPNLSSANNRSPQDLATELAELAGDGENDNANKAFLYLSRLSNDELLGLTSGIAERGDNNLFLGLAGLEVTNRLRNGQLKVADIITELNTASNPSRAYYLLWSLNGSFRYFNDNELQEILNIALPRLDIDSGTKYESKLAAVATCNSIAAELISKNIFTQAKLEEYGRKLSYIIRDDIEHKEVRRAAVNGIGETGYGPGIPTLIERLDSAQASEYPDLARSACIALGRLNAHEAIPVIGELLTATENEYVYASAATALGLLGGENSLRLLIDNAGRFNGDYAGTAIRKFDALIGSWLASGDTENIKYALKGGEYFYEAENVNEFKSSAIELLDSDNKEIIRLALIYIQQRVNQKQAGSIIEKLPRHELYSEQWDWLEGFSKSKEAPVQQSQIPVDESDLLYNTETQEYADPGYQDNGWWYAGLDWLGHTGLCAGVDPDNSLRILEMAKNGLDIGVQHNYWDGMGGDPEYWGAFTLYNQTLSFYQRRNIVSTAVELTGYSIGYPALPYPDCLRYHSNPGTYVSPTEVSQLRCDGVVEYCYEWNNVWVWGANGNHYDISRTEWVTEHNDFYEPFAPYNPDIELAPIVQCGDAGGSSTYMTRDAVTSPPTYNAYYYYSGSTVDLYVTANDVSGIHYIKYTTDGGSTWRSSPVQSQHPNSSSYTAHFSFYQYDAGYVYFYAKDNGNNYPEYAEGIWIEPGSNEYSIAMYPNDYPIYVPRGGYFEFDGVIHNNTTSYRTVDIWVKLGLPGGGTYGPVKRIDNIGMPAGKVFIAFDVRQDIPTFAPTGTYDYIAYCGNYPGYIVDYYSFEFNITGAVASDNDKWSLHGWFDEYNESAPTEFALTGVYPNPFNASTTISYSIADETDVKLEIFNLMGQRVDVPLDERRKPGEYTITWDASGFSSGIYFAILNTGEKSISRRMTLVK